MNSCLLRVYLYEYMSDRSKFSERVSTIKYFYNTLHDKPLKHITEPTKFGTISKSRHWKFLTVYTVMRIKTFSSQLYIHNYIFLKVFTRKTTRLWTQHQHPNILHQHLQSPLPLKNLKEHRVYRMWSSCCGFTTSELTDAIRETNLNFLTKLLPHDSAL